MILLSILIPTLTRRKEFFFRLHNKLNDQIARHGLASTVEILTMQDDGELSIGYKRNRLIEQAQGTFVVFVDDDDDVSSDYVSVIVSAIETHPEIDCIGIRGQVTFRGRFPRPLVYSIRYSEYCTREGVYCRPPQHLTPIRREIALRYRFAETSYSEDYDWALQLREARVLRQEHFIDEVLYYYHSRRHWAYQWLLDRTEGLRHALGLQLVNRIRVRRRADS